MRSVRRDVRSDGWRERAEAACGNLSPDPSATLMASEIASFAFCPQAWYLQRCRLPVTEEAERRRQVGSRLHREIGRDTDLVRVAGLAQRLLLVGVIALLALLVVLVLRGSP